jgi:hypothetical protein
MLVFGGGGIIEKVWPFVLIVSAVSGPRDIGPLEVFTVMMYAV